jgi:ketosteroid isomerase-like protein
MNDVAGKVLERYLSSLEEYDLDATLECFTEDVFYSHPPYPNEPGGPRHEVSGKAGLAALFAERGKRSGHHRIELVLSEGRECLAAGSVEVDGVQAATFLARFTLSDTGQIARYAAYASFPAVGATLADAS